MEDIKYRIENNYLLGCIKHNGEYRLYLMPMAWWILNYSKYDPSYNPSEWKESFRGDVLNVSDDRIDDFFRSILLDEVKLKELVEESHVSGFAYLRLSFFIDFDEKIFVNGARDNVEPEEYLPDKNWKGKVDNPKDYLPKYLQEVF